MALSAATVRESEEPRRPAAGRTLVAAHVQILAGAAALAGGWAAWRFLGERQANYAYGAWAAAGIAGTLAFGWAMGRLESLAAGSGRLIRWPVELYKRVLLAGELAALVLALAGASRLAWPAAKYVGSLFHA